MGRRTGVNVATVSTGLQQGETRLNKQELNLKDKAQKEPIAFIIEKSALLSTGRVLYFRRIGSYSITSFDLTIIVTATSDATILFSFRFKNRMKVCIFYAILLGFVKPTYILEGQNSYR